MIWLVAMGISRHHGSELLVGWQWLCRLRAEGVVTAFVSKVFDDPIYLDSEDCSGIRFIDTRPSNPEDINRRHLQHTYRFWRQVRQELQRDARAGDRVVIVSPSAIWFLPYLGGLPIPRRDVFYGPIGAVRLSEGDASIAFNSRLRDFFTYGLCFAWCAFSNWLPERLSLRYPAPWFLRIAGPKFELCATLPEVEIPAQTASEQDQGLATGPITLLYDSRLRKNFEASLQYALQLAIHEHRSLVLIGAPPAIKSRLVHRATPATPLIRFLDRMPRELFTAWLKIERPTLVSLSLSEGVPSVLLEALAAGCDLHVYSVGGISWLVEFASIHKIRDARPRKIDIISWDADSISRYHRYVANSFHQLSKAIFSPGVGDRLC
jgi:hypothetical protein